MKHCQDQVGIAQVSCSFLCCPRAVFLFIAGWLNFCLPEVIHMIYCHIFFWGTTNIIFKMMCSDFSKLMKSITISYLHPQYEMFERNNLVCYLFHQLASHAATRLVCCLTKFVIHTRVLVCWRCNVVISPGAWRVREVKLSQVFDILT